MSAIGGADCPFPLLIDDLSSQEQCYYSLQMQEGRAAAPRIRPPWGEGSSACRLEEFAFPQAARPAQCVSPAGTWLRTTLEGSISAVPETMSLIEEYSIG